MPQIDEEQKPHLSDFNDKWNKLALGISDRDVPSQPRDRPASPTSEGREEFKCGVNHPSLGVLCDKERWHAGDHRGYIEQHDAVEFWPQAAPSDLSGFSAGPWTACRMVHEERGDDLTPDELGEYVKNSVIKSAQASGSTAFLFVSCEKPDGPADVCHVGNGPTSQANARLIAAAPDLLRENTELRATLAQKDEQLQRIGAACGFPVVTNTEQLADVVCKGIERRDKDIAQKDEEIARLKGLCASAFRDVDMGIHLEPVAGTDPDGWLYSALDTLRKADGAQ